MYNSYFYTLKKLIIGCCDIRQKKIKKIFKKILTVFKSYFIINFVVASQGNKRVCRSGGTGRRTGLKILRWLNTVPVRFRSSAPTFKLNNIAGWSSW